MAFFVFLFSFFVTGLWIAHIAKENSALRPVQQELPLIAGSLCCASFGHYWCRRISTSSWQLLHCYKQWWYLAINVFGPQTPGTKQALCGCILVYMHHQWSITVMVLEIWKFETVLNSMVLNVLLCWRLDTFCVCHMVYGMDSGKYFVFECYEISWELYIFSVTVKDIILCCNIMIIVKYIYYVLRIIMFLLVVFSRTELRSTTNAFSLLP